MNLSSFDLNHARALHHLLEEAHVTRAARRLGITPAATSNALQRLRADFADPLLVRTGRTFVRTPRAEELRAPAREMMAAAERLFVAGPAFDPRTASWKIVVTTTDRVAELLLPTLDRLLRTRAPLARLTLRTSMVDVAGALRERGGLAIAAGYGLPDVFKAPDLRAVLLFREESVCVLRKGHPLGKGRLTPKRLAALEHVLVAPQGQSWRGPVDAMLEEQGLSRRVSRVVMSFSLVLPLVAGSDRVAILPRSLAERSGLQVRPVPFALPTADMTLGWHVGSEGDPRHAWTRALLHEVAGRLSGTTSSSTSPRRA